MSLLSWLSSLFGMSTPNISPVSSRVGGYLGNGTPFFVEKTAAGKIVSLRFTGRSQDDGDGAKTSHGDADYQPRTSDHIDGHSLDADAVPYAVFYPQMTAAAKGLPGCRVVVTKISTGRSVEMVAGDGGPRSGYGEVSDAGNVLLGNSGSPTHGGDASRDYAYEFFPGQGVTINGTHYSPTV